MNIKETVHQNYIRMIFDFCAALKEIRQEKPSVSGMINGQSFQDFSYFTLFFEMMEIEKSIKNPILDEKYILNTMKESVKQIIPDFEKKYKEFKKTYR